MKEILMEKNLREINIDESNKVYIINDIIEITVYLV